MSDGSFSFNFAAGDVAVEHMTSVNSKITQELADLDGFVKKSLAGWTGDAKSEYEAAKIAWDAAAARMPECLQRAAQGLKEIEGAYAQANQNASNMFR